MKHIDIYKIFENTDFLEKRDDHATSSSYIIANMGNGSRTVLTSKKTPVFISFRRQTELFQFANFLFLMYITPETANIPVKKRKLC